MANTLKFKRGLLAGLPSAAVGEPLFTTDTFDLYIGTASGTQKYQKFIASGTTSQLLRGDGSLLTMPIVLSSPANGEVLKYNGTNWVNSSDAGITGSGVAGQVAYFTGATTQGGSNNLFWDASNNRLGIGITTPATSLSISGSNNTVLRGIILRNSSGVVSSSVTLDFETSAGTHGDEGTMAGRISGIRLAAGTSGALSFSTTNAGVLGERMRIDNLGNVGIGLQTITSAPSYKSINISGTNGSEIYLYAGSTHYGYIYGDSNGMSLAAQGATRLELLTNSTQRARITSGGNFIINNASTDNGLRFQVTGDGYFSGSVSIGTTSTAQKLNVSGTGNYLAGFINSAGTLAALINFTNTSGDFFIGNDSVGGGALSGTPYARAIWGQGAYPMVFGTNNIERMRLDASGNLGLGVVPSAWTNNYRVHEIQSGWVGANDISTIFFGQNNFVSSGNWVYKNTAAATQYRQTAGQHQWYNAPSGTAGNAITFTQAMTLDASGNLGIGTTNPLDRLHVNNGDFFFGNESNVIQNIRFRRNAATVGSIGTYGNQIEINGGSTLGAGHLAITSGGNIILGFTGSNTGEKLQVNGTMRVSGNGEFISSGSENILTVRSTWSNAYLNLSRADNSSLAYLQFRTGATNNWQIGTPVGGTYLWFLEAGVERFRIANGGAATFSSSVTTTPTTGGTGFYANGAADYSVRIVNTQSAGTFYGVHSVLNGGGGTKIAGYFTATGAGTNYAAIFDSGNVGIGISTPAQKLDVTGSANSIQARFGNVAGRGLTIGTSAISGTNDAGVVFNAPTATDGTLIFQTTSVERARISGSGNLLINTTSDTGYKLRVNGTSYFDDNLRFPNLKGCVFVQTGGSLLGSIAMDSANAVTIDNNGFAGLSVGGSYTMTGGNLGIGHSAFGTSATKTISVNSGTAPSTSPADAFQLYSADITAGNAAPHFRTENGGIIKLYQQTTAVTSATYIGGAGTTVTDLDTFDGYTIPQIVKALRNAGLLA